VWDDDQGWGLNETREDVQDFKNLLGWACIKFGSDAGPVTMIFRNYSKTRHFDLYSSDLLLKYSPFFQLILG